MLVHKLVEFVSFVKSEERDFINYFIDKLKLKVL